MDTSTSRVAFVRNLEKSDFVPLKDCLLLLSSLTPEETCQLLDLNFHQEFTTRRILGRLNEILRIVGSKSVTLKLVDKLVGPFILPHKKKDSCAGCLSYLYDYARLKIFAIAYCSSSLSRSNVFLRRRVTRSSFRLGCLMTTHQRSLEHTSRPDCA